MESCVWRRAARCDLPQILRLVEQAQRFLAACGVDQWQDGFPTADVLRQDITCRQGYVVTVDGIVSAFVCLSLEPEEAYAHPIRGGFRLSGPYATIHRTAVDDACRGRGLSHILFSVCQREAAAAGKTVLRIDTHPDNARMRHIIRREGFTECAEIRMGNGTVRIVYEKQLERSERKEK